MPQAAPAPPLAPSPRLGFAVRVVGKPSLRSHQPPRKAGAHLSVNLVYLRDILAYLHPLDIRFYRLSSSLLPIFAGSEGTSEPVLQRALRQVQECAAELCLVAERVRAQGVRLTMHLGHHVVPGHASEALACRSLEEIEAQALLLELLTEPSEGVLVVHVGGASGERAALERFACRYLALSPRARLRLAVEHDTAGFSLGALLWLHQQCGIPVVFDALHYHLHNPEHFPLDLALGLALATWPAHRRPKVHLSTARTEAHLLPGRRGSPSRVVPPRTGQHADFVAVADLVALLEAARGVGPFDVMLEAKAGDLALLRLRSELTRLAPELANRCHTLAF
ncbi:MAG: UV damage endonuclease UvsE [Chloroflexaceae bacterium]|nr:UV damage endonuclease UvsE [Chloroflexaceae bacterium]